MTFPTRIFTFPALLIGVALLSGCALSDSQRYQRINDVLDAIDYETAGKIVTSRKDRGDGVFSPSFIQVEYQDSDVFETLKKRVSSIPDKDCMPNTETQIWCTFGQVDFTVKRATPTNQTIILKVTDVFNGRETK